MIGFEITNAMGCLSISDPRKVPALPVRPSWLAEESMNREADISKAVQGIMTTWNAWTDCVEKVFQQMGNQTADLQVRHFSVLFRDCSSSRDMLGYKSTI